MGVHVMLYPLILKTNKNTSVSVTNTLLHTAENTMCLYTFVPAVQHLGQYPVI